LRYKEQTGDANTPYSYTTSDGYKLGSWQSNQRYYYKNSKLDTERIKRLEEIGFIWSEKRKFMLKPWDFWYGLTLICKEHTSNANAPHDYKTPEGFYLGRWQSNQRKNYKKNVLSHDKIKRLEDIGFKWTPFEEAFEKGFQETLRYKEQTDDANVLQSYKTSENYNLGTWQNTQRANYKKGILSADRIKRLEEIGFKWKLKKK